MCSSESKEEKAISCGPSGHVGLHVFCTVDVRQYEPSRCTSQYGSDVPHESAASLGEREQLRLQGRRRTHTGTFPLLISMFLDVLVFVRAGKGRSFGFDVRDDA